MKTWERKKKEKVEEEKEKGREERGVGKKRQHGEEEGGTKGERLA